MENNNTREREGVRERDCVRDRKRGEREKNKRERERETEREMMGKRNSLAVEHLISLTCTQTIAKNYQNTHTHAHTHMHTCTYALKHTNCKVFGKIASDCPKPTSETLQNPCTSELGVVSGLKPLAAALPLAHNEAYYI